MIASRRDRRQVTSPAKCGNVRRRGFSAVLGAVLVVAVAACGVDTTATSPASTCGSDRYGCIRIGIGEPISLGALLWLAQESGGLGTDTQRGIELAIDYLDGEFDGVPGQLLGHDVQVTLADEGCNAEGGRRGARFLAEDSSVVGVEGTSCSGSALGAADKVLSESGILLVSPSNTAPDLTEPYSHERFYARVAPNDKIQGGVVGEFVARSLGARRATTITDGSPYTSGIVDVFGAWFRLFGGAAVTNADLTAEPSAVSTVVEQVANSNPDVVYFPLTGTVCADVAAALRADPRTRDVTLIVSDGCLSTGVLAAAGSLPRFFVSAPDQSSLRDNGFYAEYFLPAYSRRFGGMPTSPYNANGFDAANLIFDALRRAASIGPGTILAIPREALREAILETKGYAGLSGVLTCTPTGDCAQAATIAIYEAPHWPVAGGSPGAQPLFSQYKTLAEIERTS